MSDDKTSLKEVVASYLRKNPEFLDEFPDVLETLEVNHQSGTAVSLIERQVESLRTTNEEIKKQLNRLVQVAAENEQLMSRLHQLTLDLMSISSKQEFFTHLGNSLLNDFNADILQIFLLDSDTASAAGDDVTGISSDDPGLEQFKPLLEKGETVCGRLAQGKLEFLFGSKARWVQSTALTPLGELGCDGMMAIGSSDPARFYPGMGTLFLDLLANVISTSLSIDEPGEQRRTA
ncbi:MAG: DUF484 family protein [Xanthomonadales bacterium]|jgi:uncharacterized protein YigA (DUF484 family)|nr:DUF484 family protein [Xanthomonadales bacterium]MDH3926242.1 DUF484 family protein [Xanthomonadales bacterium]MDH4001728.1 DUF484 family protein [Xanthomonadales bacterium]